MFRYIMYQTLASNYLYGSFSDICLDENEQMKEKLKKKLFHGVTFLKIRIIEL